MNDQTDTPFEDGPPATLPTYFYNHDKLPALFAALADAQGKFLPIVRDKLVEQKLRDKDTRQYTGVTISFWYADLASILAATITPGLSPNGLTFIQPLTYDGNVTWLHSILAHKDGGMIICSVQVPRGSDIKVFGQDITYLRRYTAGPMLGVSAEDDLDENGEPKGGGDDGGGEQFPPRASERTQPARTTPARKSAATTAGSTVPVKPGTINQGQVKYLLGKVKSLQMDEGMLQAMCERLKIDGINTNLTIAQFNDVSTELDRVRDA